MILSEQRRPYAINFSNKFLDWLTHLNGGDQRLIKPQNGPNPNDVQIPLPDGLDPKNNLYSLYHEIYAQEEITDPGKIAYFDNALKKFQHEPIGDQVNRELALLLRIEVFKRSVKMMLVSAQVELGLSNFDFRQELLRTQIASPEDFVRFFKEDLSAFQKFVQHRYEKNRSLRWSPRFTPLSRKIVEYVCPPHEDYDKDDLDGFEYFNTELPRVLYGSKKDSDGKVISTLYKYWEFFK